MTIKLTKQIHSQRRIMNLQFNICHTVLNVHKGGLHPILFICYFYLFTLH